MMKKWSQWSFCLSGLGLMFSTLGHAQSGFYAAVQGGFITGNGLARTNYNTAVHTEPDHSPLGGRSLLGGIFAGGGGFLGKVYLGLRGGWAYQNLQTDYRQSPSVLTNMFYSVTLKQTYDLTGILGFSPREDMLLYLKMGSTWGRWSASSNNFILPNRTAAQSTFRPGFGIGLGIESAFCPSTCKKRGQWIWGGEYTYTNYSAFRLANDVSVGGPTTITPRTSTFTIHIKRTFRL